MQNLHKLALLIACCAFSLGAFASHYEGGKTPLVVQFHHGTLKNETLSIQDAQGNTLYTRTLSSMVEPHSWEEIYINPDIKAVTVNLSALNISKTCQFHHRRSRHIVTIKSTDAGRGIFVVVDGKPCLKQEISTNTNAE